MTPETSSVTYCSECGRERTEAEKGTRTPCPDCKSTFFGIRIKMEHGIFHHVGFNVSTETQKTFEIATWKAAFREMDMAALRAVGKGSKKLIPDIPVGYELEVQETAMYIHDERIRHGEWKYPHNRIQYTISIFALILSVIAIAVALGSKGT